MKKGITIIALANPTLYPKEVECHLIRSTANRDLLRPILCLGEEQWPEEGLKLDHLQIVNDPKSQVNQLSQHLWIGETKLYPLAHKSENDPYINAVGIYFPGGKMILPTDKMKLTLLAQTQVSFILSFQLDNQSLNQ